MNSEITDPKYFSLKKVKTLSKDVEKKPQLIKEIVKLAASNDLTLAMRSTWALQHISFEHPELLSPHIGTLVKALKKEKQHTGAQRNIIRIFHEIDIPEKYVGEIFDSCINFTKNATLPHAVRAFAITTLGIICKTYPELKPEVELILSELRSYPQPPSITVCIRKTLKVLNKLSV
jgi:hypothetical protein